MTNNANIYPNQSSNPTIANSDASRANLGLCFSGGGSRALTCAWGQLLGLKTLKLDTKARYISSVSGGTWASSIYCFLPASISDEALLGSYHPPATLSLDGANNPFNVNNLDAYSFGQAPKALGLTTLSAWGAFYMWWYRKQKYNYKWFWASVVAQYILAPFGLRAEGDQWWSSTHSFCLSLNYANGHFPSKAPATDNFFFARPERPFVIMNDNIMESVANNANIVQLPNQATPVSAGAKGQTPDGEIVGGGTMECYGYNSTLEQSSASSSPVDITINQPYSLIDSVSTSSAFFAETLARYFDRTLKDRKHLSAIAQAAKKHSHKVDERSLLAELEHDLEDLGERIEKDLAEFIEKETIDPADFVPTYNYWPIGTESTNKATQYTDGGTLDNTGVIGILSQTDNGSTTQDPLYLVVFDNTDTPLQKIKDNIIAGSQAAPLFGIDFNTDTGSYQPFTAQQQDPTSSTFMATSLIQVFANNKSASGSHPFDDLVQGLYKTNSGGDEAVSNRENMENTAPAFHRMTLTTVDNALAKVSAGRSVHVLYIQNALMLNWQNKIGDEKLKQEIVAGQKDSYDPFADFSSFPDYSTFFKIGLESKESNALSQMWAWALADDDSALKPVLTSFIKNA